MAKRKGIRQQIASMTASGQTLEKQIQSLIEQKKYAAAIRKLQQGLKRDPQQSLTVSEADIWLLQGKYEFEQVHYPQAKSALHKALELGLYDGTYYWIAKCSLEQNQPAAALTLFQTAFDDKTLPKDMGGCYLKLLFLNDEADEVERLLETQAKRFFAPQLHWARGAQSLEANRPKDALPHFKKMGRPASPDDQPMVWLTYADQQAGEWAEAESAIAASQPSPRRFSALLATPPALQALIRRQVAHTQRAPQGFFFRDTTHLPNGGAGWVLEVLALIHQDNVHDAAHLVIDPPDGIMAEYPALEKLYRPILLLAGEQARKQQEFDCSAEFWGEAIDKADGKADFDPNLALNLYKALDLSGDYSEAQRLLERTISWLQQTAEQNPGDWPQTRLSTTLAVLYCWQADCQMSLGRDRDAERTVQKAEKLAPNHPAVLGRKGLALLLKGDEAAVGLLTQALEAGTQFEEVYGALLEALEDDPDALKAVRRKFGSRFGDGGVDTEVEMPPWVEALTFQDYATMEQFVRGSKQSVPTLQALQIFLDSAADRPSSGQKITLNLEKAMPQWEKLLAAHSPEQQVEIIKAVYFVIQQHAKRNKKGIKALQGSYYNKIIALAAQQVPGSNIAQLMLLVMQQPTQPSQPAIAVEHILSRTARPEHTLARAQLEVSRFGYSSTLKTFLEAQLKQDSQNPLLLLANATTYPSGSAQYETFHEKGFELARRLQDAEALQAFREQEWLEAQEITRRVAIRSGIDLLGDPSQLNMAEMIKHLAREAFGAEVPPEILAQMLPELMAGMDGNFEDNEDDFDTIFNPFSIPRRKTRKKSAKKRKS